MVITELKKEFVIQTIAKGTRVVMCDFKAMRIIDCKDMTVGQINNSIAKDTSKFFTVESNEE